MRDTAGRLIAGARIYMEMQPGQDRHAVADADGRFEVRGLDAGRHHLSVGHDGWRSSVVMPGEGEDLRLDIELPDAAATPRTTACARRAAEPATSTATLTGRVLRDGAPVSHFAIVRRGTAPYSWITAPAMIHAPDGRFSLGELRPSSGTVHILALGTAWTDIGPLELTPGVTTDLGDLSLTEGARIVGTVRDSTGASVSGATVTLGSRVDGDRDALADAVDGYFATTSDPDGRFELVGVHVRPRHVRLAAHHPARGRSLEQEITMTDLVLLATGSIEGTVDAVADHAGVIVRGEDRRLGSRVGRVRPSGAFTIDGLVPGTYTVELVQRPDWPPREATVTVVAGQRARVHIPPPR